MGASLISGAHCCCFGERSDEATGLTPRGASSATLKPSSASPSGTDGQQLLALLAQRGRHLVIHMDINKTVMMCDTVSGKDALQVVNEVLANTAWGTEVDGRWALQVEEPCVRRPPNAVSYAEWVERQHPGRENSTVRNGLNGAFSKAGGPGASLSGHAERMLAALKMPDGSDVRLIPAFFELLIALKLAGRSFTLCFRSFGEDMAEVAEELNAFCEGRHPLFPDVVFDGSDGEPDYRLSLASPDQCGTFYREDSTVSLIMGTIEQPGEGRHRQVAPSISFYEGMPGVRVVSGSELDICALVQRLTSARGSLALRDHFFYWKSKKMSSSAGKILFFDPSPGTNSHEIFFDDNIRYSETYIVHPIEAQNPGRRQWASSLLLTHLCRAEPLESISDRQYFVRQVVEREKCYDRKLRAKERLSRVLRKVKTLTHITARWSDAGGQIKPQVSDDYDPWRELRRDNTHISLTGADEDPSL